MEYLIKKILENCLILWYNRVRMCDNIILYILYLENKKPKERQGEQCLKLKHYPKF